MFTQIVFGLLYISLSGVVQGSFNDDFTMNVGTSVTNLLGVNCMVESVLDLEDAADEFSYEIRKKCGQAVNLANELADAKDLMKISTKVIDINDDVCDNAGYDEEKDADTIPTTKCATNLTTEMANLLTSFVETRKDINSALQAFYSSGACVKIAMSNFKYFLGTFGSRIARCADLAAEV